MQFRNLSLIAVSLFCAISGAQAQDQQNPSPPKIELKTPEVSVPLYWNRRNPVVDVKINGHGPYRFFLDTGAQGSVLGLDLAKELQLPMLAEMRIGSPGGKGIPAKRVHLDRIEIGGAVLSSVPAVAFDRAALSREAGAPRGVFSAKSFPGYLLTVNYPQERLVIRAGELPAADGASVFSYDPKLPLPEIPISVAGHEATLHLDTGAPSGITLPLEFAEQLPLESKPVEVGRGRRVDQEVIILGAKLKGDVKVGQFVLHNPDLRFQNIPGAKGNIGGEFLRRFAVTLDSKNCRIRLEEVPGGPAQSQQRLRRYGIRFGELGQTPLAVVDVDADSLAAKAGLRKGDVILEMNGKSIQALSADERMKALTRSPLHLQVQRDSKTLALIMNLESTETKDRQ